MLGDSPGMHETPASMHMALASMHVDLASMYVTLSSVHVALASVFAALGSIPSITQENVMNQFLVTVANIRDNGFIKMKCLLWLIGSEFLVWDRLSLSPWTYPQ